jgi:hypothetical protein
LLIVETIGDDLGFLAMEVEPRQIVLRLGVEDAERSVPPVA